MEDISDAQLAQLVQQGSEAGDTWLAATETQRRKDMRDRYQAQQAKQQAANPPDIMTQRVAELGGGIPSADPNIGAPPDPSLQTGIAGPPQGGPPPGMASGGLIQGYQNGGGVGESTQAFRDIGERSPAWSDVANVIDPYSIDIPVSGHARQSALNRQKQMIADLEQYGGTREDLTNMEAEIAELRAQMPPRRGRTGRGEVLEFRDAPYGGDSAITNEDRVRELEDAVSRIRGYSSLEQLMMPGGDPYPEGLQPHVGDTPQETAWKEAQREQIGGEQAAFLAGRAEDADGADVDGDVDGEDEEITDYEDLLRLGDPVGEGALSRSRSIIDTLRSELRDISPEDEDAARLRMSAADEAQRRARGIHSLRQGREREQERILAHRLGLSEEAVRELRAEMDTPGQIEDRRQGAGWGALSSMFLNPDLAAGIGGMGERIRGTDALIKAERESALEKIRAERERAGLLEQEGRTDIFGTKLRGQQGLDTAELARLDLDYDVAQGLADKGRAGAERLATLGLGVEGMAYEGEQAIAAAHIASAAAFQEALNDRESFLSDPKNWEAIMNRHADSIGEIESNRSLTEAERIEGLKSLHELAIKRIQAIGVRDVAEINRIMAMGQRRRTPATAARPPGS